MNYEKNIVQGIDIQMKEFFKNIEEKYKVSKEELMDMWKGKTETTQKATPAPKDNKKSNYQKFFSIQRNIIMEQQPGLSFGEISKQVSVLWKQMSVEEKNRYTDINPIPLEKIKVSQTPIRKTKSSPPSKGKNDDSSNTIQIIHRDAAATPRRSDLEIHQEDKDKENDDDEENDEEDFFFEQDDQNESYDDNTIDDDDDSNDAELFDDQE